MPHTSRNQRRKPTKRVQFDDEEGWTHVTNTHHIHATKETASTTGMTKPPKTAPFDPEDIEGHRRQPLRVYGILPGASVEKAQLRYNALVQRWLESESWATLKTLLQKHLLDTPQKITRAVLFGSGTATGLVDQWIERHDVAITQIAIFKTMVDLLGEFQDTKVQAYAQEPVYNDLDIRFLSNLGVEVSGTPHGYELLDEHTLAYAPGAEYEVVMAILFRSPCFYLGHNMEHYISRAHQKAQNQIENDRGIVGKFNAEHHSVKIPDLEAADWPFYSQRLYYASLASELQETALQSSPEPQ